MYSHLLVYVEPVICSLDANFRTIQKPRARQSHPCVKKCSMLPRLGPSCALNVLEWSSFDCAITYAIKAYVGNRAQLSNLLINARFAVFIWDSLSAQCHTYVLDCAMRWRSHASEIDASSSKGIGCDPLCLGSTLLSYQCDPDSNMGQLL